MSSFTYCKKYFIEAAGFLAGIAYQNGRYNAPLLRMFNFDTWKPFTEVDYYNTFCNLYFMNAESVRRQYKDPEREEDPNEYREVFQEAKKAAQNQIIKYRCNGDRDFLLSCFRLCNFFDGILYQIEDPEFSYIAGYILNDIRSKMVDIIGQFIGLNGDRDNINGWSGLQVTQYTRREA